MPYLYPYCFQGFPPSSHPLFFQYSVSAGEEFQPFFCIRLIIKNVAPARMPTRAREELLILRAILAAALSIFAFFQGQRPPSSLPARPARILSRTVSLYRKAPF